MYLVMVYSIFNRDQLYVRCRFSRAVLSSIHHTHALFYNRALTFVESAKAFRTIGGHIAHSHAIPLED
jgi:hypothetical protein